MFVEGYQPATSCPTPSKLGPLSSTSSTYTRTPMVSVCVVSTCLRFRRSSASSGGTGELCTLISSKYLSCVSLSRGTCVSICPVSRSTWNGFVSGDLGSALLPPASRQTNRLDMTPNRSDSPRSNSLPSLHGDSGTWGRGQHWPMGRGTFT